MHLLKCTFCAAASETISGLGTSPLLARKRTIALRPQTFRLVAYICVLPCLQEACNRRMLSVLRAMRWGGLFI